MHPHGGDHRASAPTAGEERGLHVCPACGSKLVQPEWWEESAGRCWRVSLRCPECGSRREGVYSQTVVDAYDERLSAASEALAAAYRRLVRDNLAAEAERFADALRAGAILPEDF